MLFFTQIICAAEAACLEVWMKLSTYVLGLYRLGRPKRERHGKIKMKHYIKKSWKKISTITLLMILICLQTACGKAQEGDIGGFKSNIPSAEEKPGGYHYVPEFITIGDDGEQKLSHFVIKDQYLYYSGDSRSKKTKEGYLALYRREIKGEDSLMLPIELNNELYITKFFVDEEENYILLLSNINTEENDKSDIETGDIETEYKNYKEESKADYILCKFDTQGNILFQNNITDTLSTNGVDKVSYMELDGDGRLYIASYNAICLFQKDGSYYGNVDLDTWLNCLGTGKDGKVYIGKYNENELVLAEIHFDNKCIENEYKNFLYGDRENFLYSGLEHDFLINKTSQIIAYDLAKESSEVVFAWLDCNINGNQVEYLKPMEKEGFLAVIQGEYGSKELTELAVITKQASSSMIEKETIKVGLIGDSDAEIQAAAVEFNKLNDKYRVELQIYTETNGGDYDNALTALNNDIISRKAPDILNLSMIPVPDYVNKGLLEDLTPYLSNGGNLKKEDIVESALDTYTVDGTLVGLPKRFLITSIMGNASQVGAEMGWTIEELMNFTRKYLDKTVFEYASPTSMLYVLYESLISFVDYHSGKCYYDSEEFKSFLEYCMMFWDYSEQDDRVYAEKISTGDLLLHGILIGDVEGYLEYQNMFRGEGTCIGYPTKDGSPGISLRASSPLYGMLSTSEQKEGAWEFLQHLYLRKNEKKELGYLPGFPTLKALLEEQYQEAMEDNVEIDENGNSVIRPKNTLYVGGWSTEIYAATPKQIDDLREIISNAKMSPFNDIYINNIVMEEVEAYFVKQKSVDEVTNIIQNRVQNYLNEKK